MLSHAHDVAPVWHRSAGTAACLVVIGLLYVRGWYRLRSGGRTVPGLAHLTAFVTGVLALWAAIGSPLAVMHHELLTVHMAQHLLLMTAAAPLMLLGDPVVTLAKGLPQPFVESLLRPVGRSPLARRLGAVLSHPVWCWLFSVIVVIGWHVPAMFQLGMQSAGWRGVAQASFFVAGLLFWWPVIHPGQSQARWHDWTIPLYLFLATLPCDALSAFLTFCDRVVYQHYVSTHQVFAMSALEDQQLAGALMWVTVTFVYLIPAFRITMRLLSPTPAATPEMSLRTL